MATFRQAVITHLREDTGSGSILEKLGNDTSRIGPSKTIRAEEEFPAMGVEIGEIVSNVYGEPFADQLFSVYIYTRTEARNIRDFVTIDQLAERVRKRLHKVTVDQMSTSVDDDFKPFEIRYDRWTSRDLFDEVIRADYRFLRFRAHGVLTSTQV